MLIGQALSEMHRALPAPERAARHAEVLARLLERRVAPGGALVVQATSPFYSRRSYWCIVRTIEAAGLVVHPFHAFVPAFGEWGFALARPEPFEPPRALRPEGLSFLTAEQLPGLFHFPADLGRVEGPVNRLDNQALVRLYEQEIGRFSALLAFVGWQHRWLAARAPSPRERARAALSRCS